MNAKQTPDTPAAAAGAQAPLRYRDAGVDIEAGDSLVERIKPAARRTLRPEVMGGLGGFGALCRIPTGYREPILVSGTDGVGTKLRLAFELQRHSTVGIDLVAMSVNDILVQGAEPLFFLDYFACGRLELDTAASVIQGVAQGCEQAGCALIGGETAEMPGMYPPGEYDLAGFAVGVVEKDDILPGDRVREGDVLLGLASSGFHSNGYSLVRKVLERSLGGLSPQHLAGVALPAQEGDAQQMPLADLVMAPTRIYVKPILSALKALPGAIHAMAHITGGGIVGNLPRVLPESLGAHIGLDRWPRPPVMAYIEAQGQVPADEMLHVFNCGLGMILAVDIAQADAVAAHLTAQGEQVYRIGEVVPRAATASSQFEAVSVSGSASASRG